MGWLSSLLGRLKPQPAPARLARTISLAGTGRFRTEVVGESHYQLALSQSNDGRNRRVHEHQCIAELMPEPKPHRIVRPSLF